MKKNQKKVGFYILWCGIAVIILPLLLYGIYMAGYEYTFYKEYKTVERLTVFRTTYYEGDNFKITLPVKFVPECHNAIAEQIVLVRSKTGKGFLIVRYKDEVVQLLTMPARYLDLKYYREAYYDITDKSAKEKLLKLLDAHRNSDE